MRGSSWMLLFTASFLAGGCTAGEEGEPRARPESDAADADSTVQGEARAPHDAPGDAVESTARDAEPHGPAAAGEGIALLPIMQKLGADMTALTYGLMTDDGEQVASSAAAMAEHAPISAEELERISRELGDDMAEFERLDEAVHVASVRLHEAAEANRTVEVLTQLNEVQRGCVACHARFRERLRVNAPR